MTWDAFFISLLNGDYNRVPGNAIADLKRVEKLGDADEVLMAIKEVDRGATRRVQEFFYLRLIKDVIPIAEGRIYEFWDEAKLWFQNIGIEFLIAYRVDIANDSRFIEDAGYDYFNDNYYKFLYEMRTKSLDGYYVGWKPQEAIDSKAKKEKEQEMKRLANQNKK